jgi:hypothetical protein
MKTKSIKQRLEYLRGELRAERLSWGELSELQDLAKYIDPGDVELLQATGIPEFDYQCQRCGQWKNDNQFESTGNSELCLECETELNNEN